MLVYNNVTMFQQLCDWYMLFLSYIRETTDTGQKRILQVLQLLQLSVFLHRKLVMYITSVLMHAQSPR